MVKCKTYRCKTTGRYLKEDEFEELRAGNSDITSLVSISIEKMSKSKLNGINLKV